MSTPLSWTSSNPTCSVAATPSRATCTSARAGRPRPGRHRLERPRAEHHQRALLAGELELGRQLVAVGAAPDDRTAVPGAGSGVAGEAQPQRSRDRRSRSRARRSCARSSTRSGLLELDQRLERALGDMRLEVLDRAPSRDDLVDAFAPTGPARDASGSWSITATVRRPPAASLTARAAPISSSETSRELSAPGLGDDQYAAHPAIRSLTISTIRAATSAGEPSIISAPAAAVGRPQLTRARDRPPRRSHRSPRRARRACSTIERLLARLLDRPQVRVAGLVDSGLDRQQRRGPDPQHLDEAALELALDGRRSTPRRRSRGA